LVNEDQNNESQYEGETLSCKIVGFYPFPPPPPKGLIGWLFRDIHEAIIIRSSIKGKNNAILLDFMTKGGQGHPVWWDENAKWNVFLGGTIEGEIRLRFLGSRQQSESRDIIDVSNNTDKGNENQISSSPKIEKLIQIANAYDCKMNLYRNNCRFFSACMEREVDRLNNENLLESPLDSGTDAFNSNDGSRLTTTAKSTTIERSQNFVANSRFAIRIFGAILLPASYPLAILWLCYGTVVYGV